MTKLNIIRNPDGSTELTFMFKGNAHTVVLSKQESELASMQLAPHYFVREEAAGIGS